jgi:single-strand DNA-binding protein
MADINTVVVSGRLTRDVELKTTPGGASVADMGLAVNRKYKNNTSGEWVEETSFFNIVVWGRQAENCAQYLSKGSPVAIEGRLRSRSWEAQDGQKRTVVEITAGNVQFLSNRGDGSEGSSSKRSDGDFTEISGGAGSEDVPF